MGFATFTPNYHPCCIQNIAEIYIILTSCKPNNIGGNPGITKKIYILASQITHIVITQVAVKASLESILTSQQTKHIDSMLAQH